MTSIGSEGLSDVADRDGSHAVPPGMSLGPLRTHRSGAPVGFFAVRQFAPRRSAAQPSAAIEWDYACDFNSPLVAYFIARSGRPKWTGRANGANILGRSAWRSWGLDVDASWFGGKRVPPDLPLPPRRLFLCGLLRDGSCLSFLQRACRRRRRRRNGRPQRQDECRRRRKAAPHRRASSHRAAALHHRHGAEMGQPAQCSTAAARPARMDPGAVDRGDGPQRRGDRDHLAVRSGRVVG